MLNKQQLAEHIGKTLAKSKVVKLQAILQQQQFKISDLVDLTFYEDKKTAFRAAWLLENYLLTAQAISPGDVCNIVKALANVTNPSCQRHYAKIVMYITSGKTNKDFKETVAGTDMEAVVDKCFSWLIDPKVLIAVKVFAAEALYNLSIRYPWIMEELKEQLIFLMKDGSAAIQSRGKKLLARL